MTYNCFLPFIPPRSKQVAEAAVISERWYTFPATFADRCHVAGQLLTFCFLYGAHGVWAGSSVENKNKSKAKTQEGKKKIENAMQATPLEDSDPLRLHF